MTTNHSQNVPPSWGSPCTQMVRNGSNCKESLPDSGHQQADLIHFLKLHIYQRVYCENNVEQFRMALFSRTFHSDEYVLSVCCPITITP
jgi:hypothetical protein